MPSSLPDTPRHSSSDGSQTAASSTSSTIPKDTGFHGTVCVEVSNRHELDRTEMSAQNPRRDLSQFFFCTLMLLSVGVLLSDFLTYIETGRWTNMSIMRFYEILTNDGEERGAGSSLIGLRYVLELVPILPVFLAASVIVLNCRTKDQE